MSYFITTPIYYVNAEPHLGHAYSTIVADVLARFQRMSGQDTFFLTGTDEHGTKILQAAQEAEVEVRAFVDGTSQRFRDLLPLIDATPDFFIRTTDTQHIERVQSVLQRLYEQGDIYEGAYSGQYCTACEAYYTEAELLEGGLCPTHKRATELLEETNYFFRLSAYEDRLRDYYAAHPDWVRPRSRGNEALAFINGGLEDISISRSSIDWGVPVPWDTKQVVYVWVDALFNYLNALGYARDGEDLTAQFWPPQVQILAKDILKFHAVIWPALLMAAGLELPERLFIHGYLMMAGDKMSKTQGNVFDPFPVIERHGPDPVRFYVLREVQFGQDGTVGLDSFEKRYTTELANDLGNLVSRTAAMASRYLPDGRLTAAPAESALAQQAAAMLTTWQQQMTDLELTTALETAWEFVRALNRHVEERAPWKLAKDETQTQLLHDTLAELAEGLVAVSHALWPVMPSTAEQIAAVFGIDRKQLHARQWGGSAGKVVEAVEPLFPRLESVTV